MELPGRERRRGEGREEVWGAIRNVIVRNPERGYLGGVSRRCHHSMSRKKIETNFCSPTGGSAALPGVLWGYEGPTHARRLPGSLSVSPNTRHTCHSFSNVSSATLQRVLPIPSSDLVPAGLGAFVECPARRRRPAAHDIHIPKSVFREGRLASSV